MTCEQRKDQLGLYAMAALDANEQAELRAHLHQGCPICQGYLAEVEAVVAQLPLGLQQVDPSPSVKSRLMERISAASLAPGKQLPSQMRIAPPPRKPSRWFDGAVGAAMAAAIAAIAFGILFSQYHQSIQSLRAQVDRHEAQLGALQSSIENADQTIQSLKPPAIQMVSADGQAQPEAFARVFIDRPRNTVYLYAGGLKIPAQGKTYELWLINDKGQKIPSGLFSVTRQGDASLERPVPADAGRVVAVAVTDEPINGVPQPTGAIQLLGKIQ